MKKQDILKILASLIIIGLLIYKVGLKGLIDSLLKINWLYLPLFLLLTFIILLVGALNIWVMLFGVNSKVKFKRVFEVSSLSWAYGLVAPGKIGEFSIIYLLNKEGITIAEGAVISILDKLITVVSLVLIVIVWLMTGQQTGLNLILASIILIMMIAAFTFMMIWEKSRMFIRKYILRRYSEKFRGFYATLMIFIKQKKLLLFADFVITVIKWYANAALPYIMFRTMGIQVDLSLIFVFSAIITITSLIPITMSGIGIKESVAVVLYNQLMGIEAATVLGVYLLMDVLKYFAALIVVLTCPASKE